jgi:hypothetical protein
VVELIRQLPGTEEFEARFLVTVALLHDVIEKSSLAEADLVDGVPRRSGSGGSTPLEGAWGDHRVALSPTPRVVRLGEGHQGLLYPRATSSPSVKTTALQAANNRLMAPAIGRSWDVLA